MILSLNVTVILVIVYLLYRSARHTVVHRFFLPGLILRIIAGFLVGWIYFYHYGEGDTVMFHQVCSAITGEAGMTTGGYLDFLIHGPDDLLRESYPILNESRSAFFIRILSLFYHLTSENYWVTGIYLSLLSFAGSWALLNALVRYDAKLRLPAAIALLFLPTFIFWSSGILKESVSWFCISMLGMITLDLLQKREVQIWKWAVAIISVFLLWEIKYYYAAVLGLCFGPVLFYRVLTERYGKRSFTYFILILSVIAAGVILLFSHSNFYPTRLMEVLTWNHRVLSELSEPGHALQFIPVDDPYIRFIVNIPVSLFGGLFMPLIWQGSGVLAKLTGVVNTVLLLFFAAKVLKPGTMSFRQMSPVALSMLFYIAIMAVLLAYSTPNFGTLERYKTSYIAFFTMWVLYGNPALELMGRKMTFLR